MSHLEVEARYYFDKRAHNNGKFNASGATDLAKNIIKRYANYNCEISQTVNKICDNVIIMSTYDNGVKINESYYSKTEIRKPTLRPGFKIAFSKETTLSKPTSCVMKFLRVKFRYSIFITSSWRYDITLIKTYPSQSVTAMTIKEINKFFSGNVTVKNFVEQAPWQDADHIEFELEYVGNAPITDELLDRLEKFVFKFDIESEYDIFTEIGNMLGKKIEHSVKRFSNNPRELYRRDYNDIDLNNYFITDKVDGIRTIIYYNSGIMYILNSTVEIIKINLYKPFIIDTEMYENKFYIFDVLYYDNDVLINLPFEERMKYFDKFKDQFQFAFKPFEKYSREMFKDFKSRNRDYETDGFIFTPIDGKYFSMIVYKYKPIEKMTIDFYCKKFPVEYKSIVPVSTDNLYVLYCGIQASMFKQFRLKIPQFAKEDIKTDEGHLAEYFAIPFQASNNKFSYLATCREDIDGKVCEFGYVNNTWVFHRIREDRMVELESGRYFGNNFRVAELTWFAYTDPLDIENDKSSYFNVSNREKQINARKFNNLVKRRVIKSICKEESSVMDLSSGNGQDLGKYAHCDSLVCLEYDKRAIQELVYRKFELISHTNLQVLQVNLNDPYDLIEGLISKYLEVNKVDNIFCNFAFHYYEDYASIAKLINNYLKPGGKFVIMCFDSKKIEELNNWQEGEYGIEVVGKGKVSVILPFSDEPYVENIVYIDKVSKEFKQYHITLSNINSFEEYVDEFDDIKLTDIDKKYVSLYTIYIFTKN